MRVLYLMDVIGGGTGNHVLALVSRMEDVEPIFATTARTVHSRLAKRQQEFYLVPPKKRFEQPVVHQARILFDLHRHARGRNVEVIHSYFFWSIFFGRILKRWIGARLLVENREDLGFQWGPFERTLLRAGSRAPDRVICVAEAVREKAVRSEKIARAKTVVVPNGFDPDEFTGGGDLRAELGIPPDAPVVGAVANFRTVKRLDRLIRASAALAAKVPNVRVVLVGRGTEEGVLRSLAAELGLEATVLFAGYRTEMATVYRTFDATVLTSESEGCSITILESFYARLPVVVTDVGGNRELVKEGETGFLVPEWDEAIFVDRVARLLADKELRARMGAKARALVLERHSFGAVAEAYRRIYAGE
ncbi:MAG: glycosyltransferase family 1 protein [Candidatus Latescibacterota bacterium]|nr:MAG: glycosyltransferase family 1 protein [Candidatus Latescibacterota bacterium]